MKKEIEIHITANEFTNVKDIRGKFLYTKDQYVFGYLKIYPFNLDLLSYEDRKAKANYLSTSYDGDRKDFSYFSFPREIDLDDYKNYLKKSYQEEMDHVGKRKILSIMLREATDLSTSGENYEHQHYIKIWKSEEGNTNDAELEVINRLEEFKERYHQVGIKSEIIEDIEIIKLCNLFGNSQQTAYEIIESNTIYSGIPMI